MVLKCHLLFPGTGNVLDEHELYGGTQKVCAEVELEDEFILIATDKKKIGNVCIVCLHNTPFT